MSAHEVSIFDIGKFHDLHFLLTLDESKKGHFCTKCQKVYNTRYLSIYTPIFEGIDTHLVNI